MAKRGSNIVVRTWDSFPGWAKFVTAGAVVYGGYRVVKSFTRRPPPANVNTAGLPIVGYSPSGVPALWNGNALANKLHDVMDGFATLTTTKDDAWQDLIDLPTDEMVKQTYNEFNRLYSKDKDDTLTQWIKDENYYDYFSGVKEKAIRRLTTLNLN